jgi:hypothetical protein
MVGCADNALVEEAPISPPAEEIPISPEAAQATVDAIRALQPTDIPAHFQEGDSERKQDDFNINSYFSLLTHLSMEPGYVLDYFYAGDFFGGRPLIYVRRLEDKPFSSYEEYSKAEESNVKLDDLSSFVGFVMGEDSNPLDNKIRVDGTAEGFVEYVILQIMGGQFYLSWHANYDDAMIICNKASLEETLRESLESLGIEISGGGEFGSELLAKARHIDFQPKVIFQDDEVVVKIVVFTKWGGFIQSSFTISRDYPHKIISIKNKTIIEYDCGVMF